MAPPLHFFFYGTLVAGMSNPVARAIHEALEPLGPASTAGTLHAIPDPAGWYPALLPGEGQVEGALYRAGPDFDADALARMDAYEDFDPGQPERSLYRRVEQAVDCRGQMFGAQVYCWNRPLPTGAVPIAGGSFAAWLAAHGHRPFGGSHGGSHAAG